MAQFVMDDLVRRAGRQDEFDIDSAATSREEIGNPPHHGTVSKLREVGVPVGPTVLASHEFRLGYCAGCRANTQLVFFGEKRMGIYQVFLAKSQVNDLSVIPTWESAAPRGRIPKLVSLAARPQIALCGAPSCRLGG